ncbi:histidinol-phosphatase [Deltaproteobacteria bacterium TL4]
MVQIKNNFHTHTRLCRHAVGDAVDYARYAWENGIHTLGISDHTPFPDNRWLDIRMSFDQLDLYERSIADARNEFPEMSLLKGLECEYVPEFHSYYQDELLGKRKFDYLIGAEHHTPFQGRWLNSFFELEDARHLNAYAKYMIAMMETRLFAFIAHPDIFGMSHLLWDEDAIACSRDILQAAEETQTPLELNANGFRQIPVESSTGFRAPYPWKPFWELSSEYSIQVLCNSDAHTPKQMLANLSEVYQLVHEFKLNVINDAFAVNKRVGNSN